MSLHLPETLPPITDLLSRSAIEIKQHSLPLLPQKGKAKDAGNDSVASTLDSILSAFSEARKKKVLEDKRDKPESGKQSDFSGYTHLILCDGSGDSESGAMGVGLQVVDPINSKNVLQRYSLRLQDTKGNDYCGTSPVAEMVGLIYALYIANSLEGKVAIGTDSKNSVEWMNGGYNVNEDHIARLVAYALHLKAGRSDDTVILEVSRDLNAEVDELARQAIGKAERPDRIRMTVREFIDLLKQAGINDAAELASPQSISVDPEALGEFLKAKGVADDLAEKAVQAVTNKDEA